MTSQRTDWNNTWTSRKAEPETSPELAEKIKQNDALINRYRETFGNDALLLLPSYDNGKLAEMERQLAIADDATLQDRAAQILVDLNRPLLGNVARAELHAELCEIADALGLNGGALGGPRSVLEAARIVTPPICDAHGRVKGQWREPSRDEDIAHLARHGY